MSKKILVLALLCTIVQSMHAMHGMFRRPMVPRSRRVCTILSQKFLQALVEQKRPHLMSADLTAVGIASGLTASIMVIVADTQRSSSVKD